jgi:hypothetical protein
MIYLIGDTHGEIEIEKLSSSNFPQGKTLTRDDYVIVLGDFGLFFSNPPSSGEHWWLKWITRKPWTTLFLDGNHDNQNLLQTLPVVERFGGKVGKYADNLLYLRRGEVYIIDSVKIFAFGGAMSTDKHLRKEGVDWWAEEVPTMKEMDYGLENLEKHGNAVDVVLTHTAPRHLIQRHMRDGQRASDPTASFLEFVDMSIRYQHWYFGHFHEDETLDYRYHGVYKEYVELKLPSQT